MPRSTSSRARTPLTAAIAIFLGAGASCVKFGGSADNHDAGRDAAVAAVASGRSILPPATPLVIDAGPPAPLDPAVQLARGKELYGRYCDFCHGKAGQGYAADEAPALANEELLANASDEFLAGSIARGRPGTTMSAWSVRGGGPLNDIDVMAIVAYLRSWQKRPYATVDAGTPNGDAQRGAPIFAARCASCHGKTGHDGKYNAVGNADFLALASDAFIATTIQKGRPGTPMVGFAGKLSPAAIADVTALIRSWQKPTEELTSFPPKPGGLTQVVINPKGPEPAFDEKADFIPVETVKKELEKKASVVIVDARAPSDYVRAHVAGAISVPFYQVNEYAPQIPKDKWIITYCACPHAASVKARDAFRALGYKKAAVLDEGILFWRDHGNPIRGGAKP